MGLNIQDLKISFATIGDGGPLPARHAHDNDDVSPALTISGVPDGAVELALVCHDPDAPLPHGWTHWTVYGIPTSTTAIAEGGKVGREGPTDFGAPGYGGPLPPEGHGTHHYYFWVYALDRAVEGEPSRADFLATYGDAILEQNRVIGTYQRG